MSTPLKFKELHIRNFLSFGNNNTVVDLSDYGSTLIIGENLDSAGANGSGIAARAGAAVQAGVVRKISLAVRADFVGFAAAGGGPRCR